MTDPELLDLLQQSSRMEWRVSMSLEGTFLFVGDEKYPLTDEQAEIMWDVMRGPSTSARGVNDD
jgi:hypothetical protein